MAEDIFDNDELMKQGIKSAALAALRHLSEAGLTGDVTYRRELTEAENGSLIPMVRGRDACGFLSMKMLTRGTTSRSDSGKLMAVLERKGKIKDGSKPAPTKGKHTLA